MLNTLQYLIVDEILLARILEQKKFVNTTEDRDEEDPPEEEEHMENEETEFDSGKQRSLFM